MMTKSNLVIIIFILAGLATIGINKDWLHKERVINWDVISYYGYLPSTFIYKDPVLKDFMGYPEEARHKIWYSETENNGRVIKTSMGIAYLYAPFFFVAKWYFDFNKIYSTGFEEEYKIALLLSSIFYATLGLIFLKKILARFHKDSVVAITLLLLGLGTNLYCYTTYEACMAHSYNFFLIASFILLTFNFFDNPKPTVYFLLGLSLGLISLARPTNLIVVLFFVILGIGSIGTKEFVSKILKPQFGLFIIGFIIIWIPQIVYWYSITGRLFYFSYGNERFYFGQPEILKGLFSARKGWYVYTPVMFLATFGFVNLYKKNSKLFYPILIFFVINIYIVFSWWCWWYGGGFGQRSLIDSYAIMAIPLAAIIQSLISGNVLKKTAFTFIVIFFISLNIFQSAQYKTSAIHWDSMSWPAYFESFGKLHPTEEFRSKLDPIETELRNRLPGYKD